MGEFTFSMCLMAKKKHRAEKFQLFNFNYTHELQLPAAVQCLSFDSLPFVFLFTFFRKYWLATFR